MFEGGEEGGGGGGGREKPSRPSNPTGSATALDNWALGPVSLKSR